MQMWGRWGVVISGLLLGLGGCSATLPPLSSDAPKEWTTRMVELSAIMQWDIRGSLSIAHGGENSIASYRWREINLSQYQIDLYGALNLYHTIIAGTPKGVTLWQSNRVHQDASTPEELVQSVLGWPLPVSNLMYWVRGLPAPDDTATGAIFGPSGRLEGLDQDGWHIEWLRYTPVQGRDLPALLRLTRPDWQVKVSITDWQ
ncbi:MAG: outer membrane lipoprotein LolB [Gammaproteobacteria bacterium RIFCSPHIGHO2_12_FULL_45_9]|nr:MAG: outer membrane lipoprotein LolB [Gammaproteobacteria bacterium RIFCSPHIGHO2_12_FULL_45_9]